MIFDTAAGELAPDVFKAAVVPQLEALTAKNGLRIGYYSKGTQPAHLRNSLFTEGGLAGVGIDSRWQMSEAFELFTNGFVQGNFDQALLFCERSDLKHHLNRYLAPFGDQERPGWICGLGHGLLPGTPEDNVRFFVDTVREVMQ
jgi:uroporphyrinogen decarboxylase